MHSNKKRLLIAGGGYADIPLIQGAKRLGFYVITSGNRPLDLGHRYADESCLADFSDETAMLEVARKLRVDAVCACCNDFSAISAAYVAEYLGLPGHDSYEITKQIHHKDRFREFMRLNGLASPRAEGFDDVASACEAIIGRFKFPVIVKPVDLTGGKGISTVPRPDLAREALDAAFAVSRAKRVVVEEFIVGSRHGLSTFIRDGRVVFYFSDNEHYFRNPFLVSAASAPGNVPKDVVRKLQTDIEKISALLGLEDGLVHVQYILCGNEPVIIEICRRAPGDLYVRFVEHATGVDYGAAIVSASAGMDFRNMKQAEPQGYFTRHCVMSERRGKVSGVEFDASIEANVIDKFMWWQNGDRIDNPLTQKFGIVFLKFGSMAEMLNKTDRMQELIRVKAE